MRSNISMEVLYLAHCAPDAPDKGDKIRAYHAISRLSKDFRLHVACLADTRQQAERARSVHQGCASFRYVVRRPKAALAGAALRFLAGASLSEAYVWNPKLAAVVEEIAATARLGVCVAYSSVMAPYSPAGVPLLLDLCDVDSEKWAWYAKTRWPGALYALEARRLRRQEVAMARKAVRATAITDAEARLFESIAQLPRPLEVVSNGVDLDWFDPSAWKSRPRSDPPYLVFVGQLNYFPNAEGVSWFAREILPSLRQRWSSLEFKIVGRAPQAGVRRLCELPGVELIDTPPDVRPWLAGALAVVAPLRMARGLQNKVLEALAMGKHVLATDEVCQTFGCDLPRGVMRWTSIAELADSLAPLFGSDHIDPAIRSAAGKFSWGSSLDRLTALVSESAGSGPEAAGSTATQGGSAA